jgi:H/ACA ribonucleoprotein complex subunit 2
MSESTPIKEKKEKKEKKDKKRKSEAADVTMDTETPIKPEVVPPAEGTASAEAVAMEVDGEKAAKKAKKEKRKSVGGDVAAEEQDAKVSFIVLVCGCGIKT